MQSNQKNTLLGNGRVELVNGRNFKRFVTIFVIYIFKTKLFREMKYIITYLAALFIVSGFFAQNPKVAIFDINQADNKYLKSDVRYTYYDGIVSHGNLDAIDVEKIYPFLEKNNYNSDSDTDYKKAIRIAKDLGADYILIPKLEIYKKTTYIFRNVLVDVETGEVVAKGEKTHQYNFIAYEQALDNLLADFGSKVSTTPSYDEAEKDENFSVSIKDVVFEMIYVEGGTFTMGNDSYESNKNEKPVHDVSLKSYYIGKTEVTFELFDTYCNEMSITKPYDESWGRGKHPVNNIGKQDAVGFCKWLSKKTGMNYRLPTEAEWEYAARGGSTGLPTTYAGSNSLYDYGWYDRNSEGKIHPVGLKLPNELGIYDMCGNVLEICSDWYDANYYNDSPKENPQGPAKGRKYSVRGGSFYDCVNATRITFRRFGGSGRNSCSANLTGFRIVCDTK